MATIDTEETMEAINNSATSSRQSQSGILTLQKAIELGEYNPEYLSQFSEWDDLSRHSQFQLIRQALDNRIKQLERQWAEINNLLDFSKKPHLKDALENIDNQRKKVLKDKEELYIKYSKV